ncbi:MAG: CinA family protein [Butyrivibrio sp.]|jgi:PncC family amidohydrolase|nr:CinA family protein [Butyrivibrio sp.]
MTDNEKLVRLLQEKKMTVTAAESCTGGLVAAAITDVAGSSEVFHRGFVTYCDEAKHEMLGVPGEILQKFTAVSQQTAEAMARGAAQQAQADCAVSVTGIAGPGGGTELQPVGLVYIGFYVKGMVIVEKHLFDGDRREVRRQAAERAIHGMLELI